jgi:pimeloyl-ACP methyl ester carboxylesterase
MPDDAVHRTLPMRDGSEIHVIERGEGPPVLLLHGVGLSAEVWSYQLRDLAWSHRVVAADLRGHGGSSIGTEGVTIQAMAGDLAEVSEALDLERAVVAGHSMGGMVCQRALRTHPELLGRRIGAVALISTSCGVGLPVPSWGRLMGAVGEVAGAGVTILGPGRPFIPSGEAGYLASRLGFGRRAPRAQLASTLRMLQAVPPEVFAKLIGEVLGFEERAAFPDPKVPVAIAVGVSDRLTPPRAARRMASNFPNASLEEHEDAGHMLMYERRDEISDLLDALSTRALAY